MTPQPPAPRVGEFLIRDFVGAGGMGTVFGAVHRRSGQQVAIKCLSAEAARNAKSRERFAHEARVQASLKHPKLAAFYEWHEVNGVPCIVMELVDGITLSQRIRGGGALDVDEAAAIFGQIVEAIGWMHERGVVHRDIKSGNIKINARGEVKLLDFGIAKTDDAPKLTATGAFVGTLQYLSPEQTKGAKADERCDIWALGVLFYEMLGGRVPFDAPTLGELLEKVARAQYAPLRQLRPETPRRAEAIVRRCLQKSPAARYQNAAQLAADVARLSHGAAAKSTIVPTDSKIWAGAGAGVLAVIALLSWSQTRAPQSNVTPTPTAALTLDSNALALGILEQPTIAPRPTQNPVAPFVADDAEGHTLTIDVFGGASQTEIWRDGVMIGKPPLPIWANIGETLDLELRREGYRTRRESITVSASSRNYSFNLERD